ncbi:hypothetical protein Trydic_g22433 [Trypoxylus dichotomus]
MGKDTDLELKQGVVGFIGENGRRVLRDGMECANRILRQLSMRAPGPTDYKTVMDPKHMPTKLPTTTPKSTDDLFVLVIRKFTSFKPYYPFK